MVICVPVSPDGTVDSSWGRAPRVRVIRVEGDRIVASAEHAVGWDALHDAGTEGGHHARIASFLRDQGVETVAAGHMGEPMVRMLDGMGIRVRLGASGDAGEAAVEAARGS
jgi:predicted Fe-Mo cluster-binding NifX family protein